ncbi:Rieske domain-containing protein [Salpingoeca rosetta]|uniref:Rieske domain-containing protein n=1 Tax=Salpingoeca rosetta (strain ATCC 50818 / BSB-021) TaxID=946362 RepID=F2UBN5_SALR5|nr:Rieske domain-containing protein [Salpingoeca rosetta]EGD73901.1 Rieske domain-containing protein [Salpingoeca rosetta]|eukprot:XP_004993464.1 Rieske domain-containing protein [Salpingoeca rosetta]
MSVWASARECTGGWQGTDTCLCFAKAIADDVTVTRANLNTEHKHLFVCSFVCSSDTNQAASPTTSKTRQRQAISKRASGPGRSTHVNNKPEKGKGQAGRQFVDIFHAYSILPDTRTHKQTEQTMMSEEEKAVLQLAEGEPQDIQGWAVKILNTANPADKVALTQRAADLWYSGALTHDSPSTPPDMPGREASLQVVEPRDMKLGKGGTLSSRIAILHSLANIEQWAIDLAWDMIARFGGVKVGEQQEPLPRDFFTDFVRVAEDEGRHYSSLSNRLVQLGSKFGELPVHNGLWQSASETMHDLRARLAIVHMVHEARGLDITPFTIQKFERNNDQHSADLLKVIYEEEITHVTAGVRWFRHVCKVEDAEQDPIPVFHDLVKKHFHGFLKPPFNDEARTKAGFTPEWYEPLVSA